MSNLIKKDETELKKYVTPLSKVGDLNLDKPFSRDIFLFETHIAGTSYIENIEELATKIKIEDRLNLFREADNEHDKAAIVVKTLDGEKIGYIPKVDNIVFSRLLDAGKLLFLQITNIEKKNSWYKIDVKVFLHD